MDAYIAQACREIEETTRGLTPYRLMAAPAGKWNSVQVLEHLLITYRSTTRVFESLKSSPAEPMPSLEIKQRIGIFLITSLGYFPEGRPAPAFAMPKGAVSPDTITEDMLTALADMDVAIKAVEAQRGSSRPIAVHPILGAMTARQWCKFHLVHTRHHLKQVRARTRAVVAAAA